MDSKLIYEELKKHMLFEVNENGFKTIRYYGPSNNYYFLIEDLQLEYNDWFYKICKDRLNDLRKL